MSKFLNKLISQWRSPGVPVAIASFLFNFSLSKLISFAGPIFLGLYLQTDVFGGIEFTWAIGPVAALVLTIGAPAAAMQSILVEDDNNVLDLLSAATALCAIAGLAATGVLLAWGASSHYLLASSAIGLFGLQASSLAYARASAWRIGNLWVEHMPTFVLLTCAILFSAIGAQNRMSAYICGFALISLATLLASLRLLGRTSSQDFVARITRSARFGLPVVAAMIAGVWIFGSGRVWFQLFGNEDGLFAYALSLRASTIIMLVTAVVIGAFSAELYKMPTREFDIATAALTAVLFVGALAYVAGAPELWLARRIGAGNADAILRQESIALVPAQAFFLGSQLLVDMRVARTGLAAAAATLSACVAGLFSLAAAGLHGVGWSSSLALTILIIAQQAVALAASHTVLAWRRKALPLAGLVSGCGGLGLCVAAWWLRM